MPHMTMLQITPASYDEPQRVEASEAATQLGEGLRMEIGNMMTRFYTDSEVQVGQVAIWMPLRYKAPLEYVTTLAHPTDRFDVADWLPKAEFVPSLPLPTTPKAWQETEHGECDCVPDLGPSHCHLCGEQNGGKVVGWAQAQELHALAGSDHE